MPLEEISPNKRRDVKTTSTPVGDLPAAASSTSLRSSALQGMLRTTTEIGDSGPFAVKPSRIPRSGSRLQSTRQRSGSFDTSLAYNCDIGAPLCLVVLINIEVRGQPCQHPDSLPIYRSQALAGLASPGDGFPGLYAHRSLITLRSHRDYHSLHSASPSVRFGNGRQHRAASPAFTDAHIHRHGPRRGYPRVGSAVTVASSPVLLYNGPPGLAGYRSDFNNSHSSFAHLPSPARSSLNLATMNAHPVNRTATPLSASLHNTRSMWNRSAASVTALPRSPTDSAGPHYYDYSESFLEEECFQPGCQDESDIQLSHMMDHAVHESQTDIERRQAQSPFGTLPGSTFKPAELPTNHNRRASEQSKHSFSGVIPRRVSSLAATSNHQESRESSFGIFPAAVSGEEKEGHQPSHSSRRATVSSYAHSSAFFVNASRSPRDLSTLAARVHSPIFDKRASTASLSGLLDGEDFQRERQDGHPQIQRNSQSEWTLPSLSFRPLSLLSHDSKTGERPKTSGDTPSKQSREILSPMPERPMSSQSRKRFSRILEIDDGYDNKEAKMTYQSLPGQTFTRLTVVEEASDTQPMDDGRILSSFGDDQVFHGDHINDLETKDPDRHMMSPVKTVSSQITIHDKSTVESLLDRHIECLGLQETDDLPGADDSSDRRHARLEDSSAASFEPKTTIPNSFSQLKVRPSTSSSCQHSSLASSERRGLVPRRLFASMDARVRAHASISEIPASRSFSSSTTFRRIPRSSGWQTLPSTVEPVSTTHIAPTLSSGELGDVESDPSIIKFKVRCAQTLSFSPSLPSPVAGSNFLSKDIDHQDSVHRRSKSEVIARQESHRRRRMRILLRTQRKSSEAQQCPASIEEDDVLGTLAQEGMPDGSWTTESSNKDAPIISPVLGYAELSAESIIAQPGSAEPTASVLLSSSMPKRWASVLASMPEPVKKGIEVVRKASVRTIHSHKSNTSIIEPLNSTRQSSQLPRVGPVPQLGPPELGPPLTSSDLNLSLRFFGSSQLPSVGPPLREVESFFSDDSSAQNQRAAVRKRFDLHSFRSGMTKSTGVLGTRSQQPTPHSRRGLIASASWQLKGQKSFEYSHPIPGTTVPMTDFQYRKRKMLERVKDWWKRQCMQKTFAMMKRKHGRNGRGEG
ncbi:hypothetical protein B0A52_05975 [Exophiala mesophila]|uniref:Uncharacterized protein n=1 Tax=Exophiala mesophila TaxID=212818 RepID=A0A438N441_EXOME|nr:hypothetical protein B0A52_05975 [Exophiala mesophila]